MSDRWPTLGDQLLVAKSGPLTIHPWIFRLRDSIRKCKVYNGENVT